MITATASVGHRPAAGRSASAPGFAHIFSLSNFSSLLLTCGSRLAEFLLNFAHTCSFSAHFLLIFCSLSPHFLLTFRLVVACAAGWGQQPTAATPLEQPPVRVSSEVICRCLWLIYILWQIRLLASTASAATATTTTARGYTSNLPCL